MLEAAERRARGQREGEAHSLQMETAKSELERQEQGRRANAKNARRLLKHPRYGDIARQSLPPDFDPDTADDFEITDVMERYVLPEIRSAMETQEKIAVEREKGRGQFLEKSLQEERDIIGAMRKDRAAADEFGSLASSYLDEQGNLRPDYDAEDAVADPALLARYEAVQRDLAECIRGAGAIGVASRVTTSMFNTKPVPFTLPAPMRPSPGTMLIT